MKHKGLQRIFLPFWLFILVLISISSTIAASNIVPVTWLRDFRLTTTPNHLKPAICNHINLTNLVSGSGTVNGSNLADLILGSAGNDTLNGRAGDDCLLGGAGNDQIFGNAGQDVLIGGDGFDICVGGGGTDIFDSSCEIHFQ